MNSEPFRPPYSWTSQAHLSNVEIDPLRAIILAVVETTPRAERVYDIHSMLLKERIAGPGAVYICDECVDLCREIIEEEGGPAQAKTTQKVPPPRSLHEQLSEYVIGQEEAK